MASLFHEVLYRPLFNLLVFLYNTVSFQDLGLAIIILTLIIRFALYPLSQKAIQSQKELFKIQPEVKELQEKYKDQKEEQAKRIMALYKEKKVNPFSGCLPILIQLPVFIALYWVFLKGLSSPDSMADLYRFVHDPGLINYHSLGFIDISEKNIYIALLAGVFQFFQSKMTLNKQMEARQKSRKDKLLTSNDKKLPNADDISVSVSKQMAYVMPVMTFLIASTLHAGVALYWATTTLFSLVQQWYVFSKQDK